MGSSGVGVTEILLSRRIEVNSSSDAILPSLKANNFALIIFLNLNKVSAEYHPSFS
jgi:hypothetical protein